MATLNTALRRLLGVLGIGLSWGVAWAALFATLALIIGILRPQDIDSGESPLGFSGIGLVVGFVSGAVFGLILAIAENRKSIVDLALMRVALWGMLGAAAWPLLTPLPDAMLLILCPLGAVCAAVAVAIARRAEHHDPQLPTGLSVLGRLLRTPLRAACASNG